MANPAITTTQIQNDNSAQPTQPTQRCGIDLGALSNLPHNTLVEVVTKLIPTFSQHDLLRIAAQLLCEKKVQQLSLVRQTQQTKHASRDANECIESESGNNRNDVNYGNNGNNGNKDNEGNVCKDDNDGNDQMEEVIPNDPIIQSCLNDDSSWKKKPPKFHRDPETLGMNPDEVWNFRYAQLNAYKQKYGHVHVPSNSETKKRSPEYHYLGVWVRTQRRAYLKNKLTAEQINALLEMGFEFIRKSNRGHFRCGDAYSVGNLNSAWHQRFKQLVEFKKEYGHIRLSEKTGNNPVLGRWVLNQRRRYHKNELSEEQIEMLSSVGFHFEKRGKSKWKAKGEGGETRDGESGTGDKSAVDDEKGGDVEVKGGQMQA